MKKQKAYIAGKISGLYIEKAIKKFAVTEERLLGEGYEPVNPIKVSPFKLNKRWNDYMKDCLIALIRCDIVVMQRDWKESKGSKFEHKTALILGIPILYE
jgi:hypothetical protein